MSSSKYNKETHKAIVNKLKSGIPVRTAVSQIGICHTSYYRWFKKGKDNEDSKYRKFYLDCSKAIAMSTGIVFEYLKQLYLDDETPAAVKFQVIKYILGRLDAETFTENTYNKTESKVEVNSTQYIQENMVK